MNNDLMPRKDSFMKAQISIFKDIYSEIRTLEVRAWFYVSSCTVLTNGLTAILP